ncbi:MAG: hypothetical protein WC966_07195 [Bradymonadales bacterium]|jgi:hypothetical protein
MRLRTKVLMLACLMLAGLGLVVGTACNEHELSPFANSLAAGAAEMNKDGATRAVDILFVVDDSNSMVEEQRGLNENFSAFLGQLVAVNADFQLAAISTTLLNGHGINEPNSSVSFNTELAQTFWGAGNLLDEDGREIDSTALREKCEKFFNLTKTTWLTSTLRYSYDKTEKAWKQGTESMNLDDIKDLFRCQGLTGTGGSAVERGLSTMIRSLNSNRRFKRSGSLLAVVFVTDENDCSSTMEDAVAANTYGDNQDATQECELKRNIEDSCVLSSGDRVKNGEVEPALGPTIDVGDSKVPLRKVCVDASAESRDALIKYYNDPESDAKEYINCPEGGCLNKLQTRRDFYDQIVEYVRVSNVGYYLKSQPSLKALDKEERKKKEEQMAVEDIIIASVINRDQGLRYNDENFPEKWCGAAGTQSYRYQLFAEMFNDPIYAPICCRREAFSTNVAGDQIETVCEANDNGSLAKFGPVLSKIGKRIGEAVASICTTKVPVTCIPEECNAGSPKCPCLRGCSDTQYFAGSEHAYNVCEEFKVVVGSIEGEDMSTLEIFKDGTDYTIDMESTFCRNRTDSPIQIKLNRNDAGRNLVYQYPQKITGK